MFTAGYPQTDCQTERMNRIIGKILHNVCAESPKRRSLMNSVVEFSLNNALYASTSYTPFNVNGLTHPRVTLMLPLRASGFNRGGSADRLADISPAAVQQQESEFLTTRLKVLRNVRDALADR